MTSTANLRRDPTFASLRQKIATKCNQSIIIRDELYATMELIYHELGQFAWSLALVPSLTVVVGNVDLVTYVSRSVRHLKVYYMAKLNPFYVSLVTTYIYDREVPLAALISETTASSNMEYIWDSLANYIKLEKMSIETSYKDTFTAAKYGNPGGRVSKVYFDFESVCDNLVKRYDFRPSVENLNRLKTCSKRQFGEIWDEIAAGSQNVFDTDKFRNVFEHQSTLFNSKFRDVTFQPLEYMKREMKKFSNVTVDKLVLLMYYIFVKSQNNVAALHSKRSVAKLRHVANTEAFETVAGKIFKLNNGGGEAASSNASEVSDESLSDNGLTGENLFGDTSSIDNTSFIFITIIEDCIISINQKWALRHHAPNMPGLPVTQFHLLSNEYSLSIDSIANTAARIPRDKILLRLINTGDSHWILGLIDLNAKSIWIFDSMRTTTQRIPDFKLLTKYAMAYSCFSETLLGGEVDINPDFTYKYVSNCPQQTNSYDCGVYCVYYAHCIIKNIPLRPDRKPNKINRQWIRARINSIPERPLQQEFNDSIYNTDQMVSAVGDVLKTNAFLALLDSAELNVLLAPWEQRIEL